MIKRISLLLLIFASFQLNAQIIIGGKYDFMLPFGAEKQFHGLQLLVEKPMNERVSYFGTLTYYFPQKLMQDSVYFANAIVPNVDPPGLSLGAASQYSMVGLSFGRRNYWINTIDNGFALYGGTVINVRFGFAKARPESYDTSKYQIQNVDPNTEVNGKGTIFNLGFGLNGGMKYDINRFGTLYFDLAFEYSILNYPTTTTALNQFRNFGSPLNFYLGIGYKKIIFMNRK